jgi:hypothetical protein
LLPPKVPLPPKVLRDFRISSSVGRFFSGCAAGSTLSTGCDLVTGSALVFAFGSDLGELLLAGFFAFSVIFVISFSWSIFKLIVSILFIGELWNFNFLKH